MTISTMPAWRKIMRSLRDPRTTLLKMMPRDAVCAEVGVWKGEFSERIYRVTQPREFHMIDPWAPYRCKGKFREAPEMDALYQGVKARLGNRPGVKIHRDTSETGLTKFPDNHFDWVYIDGNHYYEFVLKDLELAFRKVKPGGFITGDDYDWGYAAEPFPFPVRKAVTDFMAATSMADIQLSLIDDQFVIAKA
jgi:hypothetical protein